MDAHANSSPASHLGWLGLVEGDYDRGVVRLATIARGGVTQVVFAWLELLPPEIPSPPPATRKAPFVDARGMFCRTTMPLADALDWYAAAMAGEVFVPGTAFKVAGGRLGAEPPSRRLVVYENVPFSPMWHGSSRLHRLIPMDPLSGALADAVAGLVKVARYRRAREWFAQQLHFDVLAYDDWVGGIALVAPDPVQRRHTTRIVERTEGGETVVLEGPFRAAGRSARLKVLFKEHRGDDGGWTALADIDSMGCAQVFVPGLVEKMSVQVLCDQRGLLHVQPPYGWWREVTSSFREQAGVREIEVPPRRLGDSPTRQRTTVWEPSCQRGEAGPIAPLHRLELLQARRTRRHGDEQPVELSGGPQDVQVFHEDRAAAVAFVHRVVRYAKTRIVFVDAFFNPADLLQFGFVAEEAGLPVHILIRADRDEMRKPVVGAPAAAPTKGDWFALEIDRVQRETEQLHMGLLDVRVSRPGRGYHDRFLLVDDALWHCGHSFNNVGGGEISVMSLMRRPCGLDLAILDDIDRSEDFVTWWRRSPPPPAEVAS